MKEKGLTIPFKGKPPITKTGPIEPYLLKVHHFPIVLI